MSASEANVIASLEELVGNVWCAGGVTKGARTSKFSVLFGRTINNERAFMRIQTIPSQRQSEVLSQKNRGLLTQQ